MTGWSLLLVQLLQRERTGDLQFSPRLPYMLCCALPSACSPYAVVVSTDRARPYHEICEMLGLAFDGDTHGTGSTGNDFGCRVEIVGVEVTHFGLGDFLCLSRGDFANFSCVWRTRTFGNTGSFFDELGCWWGFGDEGE